MATTISTCDADGMREVRMDHGFLEIAHCGRGEGCFWDTDEAEAEANLYNYGAMLAWYVREAMIDPADIPDDWGVKMETSNRRIYAEAQSGWVSIKSEIWKDGEWEAEPEYHGEDTITSGMIWNCAMQAAILEEITEYCK